MSPAGVLLHIFRRTYLVDPRLQAGAAASFALLIVAAGAVFTWFFGRAAVQALRDASYQAHYHFASFYDILGGLLVRHLAALFGGALAGSAALAALLLLRIRCGVERLEKEFRVSSEGDLSSWPAGPRIREVSEVGKKTAALRARTLSRIAEIRGEVDLLRKEPLPREEFDARWNELRRKVARLSP